MRRSAWFRHTDRRVTPEDLAPIPVQPVEDYDAEELAQAIVKLPAKYKEVILLYYYEGFTQTEIAETLHVSITTVHRRLEKAYGLLKKELKGGSIYEV